jgi:hypothetical protein
MDGNAVNELLESLAHLIDDWGWLLVLAVFFGGGEALAGRRRNAKLRAQVKAGAEENKRLIALLGQIGGSSQAGTDVAALAARASEALDDRAELIELLNQVQAADRAYPQLPEEIKNDVEQTLRRLRTRVERKP